MIKVDGKRPGVCDSSDQPLSWQIKCLDTKRNDVRHNEALIQGLSVKWLQYKLIVGLGSELNWSNCDHGLANELLNWDERKLFAICLSKIDIYASHLIIDWICIGDFENCGKVVLNHFDCSREGLIPCKFFTENSNTADLNFIRVASFIRHVRFHEDILTIQATVDLVATFMHIASTESKRIFFINLIWLTIFIVRIWIRSIHLDSTWTLGILLIVCAITDEPSYILQVIKCLIDISKSSVTLDVQKCANEVDLIELKS